MCRGWKFAFLWLAWLGLSARISLAVEQEPWERLIKALVDVYVTVQQEAADPVHPDQAIYQGAIPGLLRRLDPHSIFFDANQFEQLKELEKSTRKGFGSVVSVLPGRVIVLQCLPGTPSAKSGMAAGDEILAINNIPLAQLDMEQLIELLSQSRQQQASLDVRRPGNARLLHFVLTPEEVASPAVDRAFALRPGIGYTRITNFETETGEQLQKAIESLGGNQLKGLILDLRNNPGGVLPAAIQVCSLFLKPGAKILTIRGRSKQPEEILVPDSAKPYEFPLVVLINGKSASASEIVAGAIQDHDRGQVLGEPSFGKGLVQSVYPLSAATGLALTTAFYYTPSGRSIQRPLQGGSLNQLISSPQLEYRTTKGRKVSGGGGIQPDEIVLPEPLTRLRAVLDASGILTTFASSYNLRHQVDEKFEVTPALLNELQVFLSESRIRPSLAEWSAERPWIESRLKQEILNQALGVEKGDQVELQRDPVVRRALKVLGVD
ncbi:MAG: S41 family peptidase [Bryobacteraceae bacterium]|nr:S41 family peptidase [Bryobacteraceae bacterium]MDW8378982.1 S41 family peptidase [Bryobacterales bacterium]